MRSPLLLTLLSLTSLAPAHGGDTAIHFRNQLMPQALVRLENVELMTPVQKLEELTIDIATVTRTTGSDVDILVGGRGRQVETQRVLRDASLLSATAKWRKLLPLETIEPFQRLDSSGRPGNTLSLQTTRKRTVSAIFPTLIQEQDGYVLPTQLTQEEWESFLAANPELREQLAGLTADQVRFAPRRLAVSELEIVPTEELVEYRPSAIWGVFKTEKEKQELARCREAVHGLLRNVHNPIPAGVRLSIELAPVNLNRALLISHQEIGTSLSGNRLRLPAEGAKFHRQVVSVELEATGSGTLFDASSVSLDLAELSGVTLSLEAVIHQDQCFIPNASLVEPALRQAEQEVLRKLYQK